MRVNRRSKYLKQTETLRAFASRQKRDIAICETDVPPDSNNTIVPEHKLREVHIVLQRLRVLPDRVKVQDHEVGLSNRPTKIALEVSRLGVHEPKLQAGASHKLSKQINTSDITSIKTPLFPKSSSLPPTSDLKNNSYFDGCQLTETSVNSFQASGSPDSLHKKRISIGGKNENVFSVDESPNINVNTISSSTTSKNESQEQTEYSPNSSEDKEMLLQNKSNPKKTRKSLEHANALYNKELRNLLADKLEVKYEPIFTASDTNTLTSKPTTRITRSSIHSVTGETMKREIYISKEEKVNSNETEKFAENQGSTSIKIPEIFSNKTSVGTKRKRYIQKKRLFPEAEKQSTQIKNCSNESKDGQPFKDNLNASPFSISKKLNEEDNKISTKNIAHNEIVKDTTEQKNRKEKGSTSFSMRGCALAIKEANFSRNRVQGECDAKIDEIIHLKKDDKFKQVALRFENEKSCNESDSSSPPLQILNLQNEKQVQSSKGVNQESHKSESESNPSGKESAAWQQANFSSRADSLKEKSSRKFEFIAKSDNTPFEESESDLFKHSDTNFSGITGEHSTNNECNFKMSYNKNNDLTISNVRKKITSNNDEISLTSKKIGYLRKRKISTDLPTITNQNISSSKPVNDSSNDIFMSLEEKSVNAKGKTKKIVTNTSSSRTIQTFATRRRVATSFDSNSSNNINSSLEETSSKNQELPKNSDSAIANEKKKIVTDTVESAINQKPASALSTCNDCNINSTLEEIQSKNQNLDPNLDLSNESEFAVVKGKKKKVVTDISTSMTSHTCRRRVTYTSNSSSNFNLHSSLKEIPSMNQEYSKDSDSLMSKEKKKKIITVASPSMTRQKHVFTTFDSFNSNNMNTSVGEIPNKYQKLSNDSKSSIIKGIKKKIDTNPLMSITRQKLASRRRVSNLTNSSNDFTMNNSSEEIQPKVQELIEGSISATVKGKKRKIVTSTSSSSTSVQNLTSEGQLLSESSDDNINILLNKNQSENLESLKESDSSSPKSCEEGTDTLFSKDSSKNVTNDLVIETETSALSNKKPVTNKKNSAKRKCSYKKERKKIKTTDSLEYEIVSQGEDKFSDEVECSKTAKHPEIQLKKQSFTESCKSSIDSSLPENCQNSQDSSPAHSADANATSKNIESETQNSIEIIAKISSEEHITLKEDNTFINVHKTVEKNGTGSFSSDISTSSSSNNSLSAVDSALLPSSDCKSKHPILIEHSLKASTLELEVSQKLKSDPQISSNALKLDLSNEITADHSTKSTNKLNKESSTFSLKETINERKESSNEEPTENKKRLEICNKKEDPATSLTVASVSKSLPIKEMQDKLSEVVAQVESESSNITTTAEVAEKSFKIDLSLSVSNALKSTKLASMPSHKAVMANYLLKQLALDQSPSKQNNEMNFSPTNLNKLEKVESEPPLCLTCDFSTENNTFKKGNEDLSNKPENVQKVTSSTSIKENDGEHTFKVPNKAAPKAKKKSVYTKSNTFLKPKTNDNNIFLQRMMSNLRGKTKYTKLFIPGTIQRRIMTSHLMKAPPNRNEKKILIPCIGHAGRTIQNPTLSKKFVKNMSEFKQTSSNKTIETVQNSALQLKNVSLLPNTNKSQIYIPEDKEPTRTENNNFPLPETHSLCLYPSIKKQNIINQCKRDNEVILKPKEQECNVPCLNRNKLHSDKGVTRKELNKFESQSPTSLTSAKCAIHGNSKPLESNSSSEIVSSLITHNKTEDKIYQNTFQVQREPSSYINKDEVSLTKQISDGSNFKNNSPNKPIGSSCESVESNVLVDNAKKTENMVEKKVNNQKNDTRNNFKHSSFNDPQTSETWNQLKQSREPQVSDKVFCLRNLNSNKLNRSQTSSENTIHIRSDDCSPQNENIELKETNKTVNSCSNEHKIGQNQSPQTNDSEQRFKNKMSNQTTLDKKYTSNLKSVSDGKDNYPKNINPSEINVPLKQQSEKFVLISNKNSIAQTQNKTIFRNSSEREKLVSSKSSDLPQDTSSKRSNLAAQVCDLISELHNLDNTTTVALNNYKKSINNEEVNQELKEMILREGLNLKSHPDRPPEWFLKFIANFRKQELWRLHQMFKIHDHLMRIESAKLNVLEKVYEELKETEGIKNDSN